MLKVAMLGRFAFTPDMDLPIKEVSLSGRSRRIWTMVAYLILHRDRGIPAQELIELLWPNRESDDPISTLQNNISRARTALQNLGIPDAKKLIVYNEGLYQWNATVETDYESFKSEAESILALPEEEQELSRCLKTMEKYTGDFLPEAADELWCVSTNLLLHALYRRLCEVTVKLLIKANEYEKAESICTRIFSTDPSDENNTAALMNILTANGKARQALAIYASAEQYCADTYGVEPGTELQIARAAAEQSIVDREMDSRDIKKILDGIEHPEGAFQCDSRVFLEIVNLIRRDSLRSGRPSQLVLMKIGGALGSEKLAAFAKKMEQIFLNSLRSGDPVTQIGPNQYAFLLPGAERINAEMIIERVRRRLRESFPELASVPRFSIVDVNELYDE